MSSFKSVGSSSASRRKSLGVQAEKRPILLRHPVNGKIDITAGVIVTPGAGTEEHQSPCPVFPSQLRKPVVELFHTIPPFTPPLWTTTAAFLFLLRGEKIYADYPTDLSDAAGVAEASLSYLLKIFSIISKSFGLMIRDNDI